MTYRMPRPSTCLNRWRLLGEAVRTNSYIFQDFVAYACYRHWSNWASEADTRYFQVRRGTKVQAAWDVVFWECRANVIGWASRGRD